MPRRELKSLTPRTPKRVTQRAHTRLIFYTMVIASILVIILYVLIPTHNSFDSELQKVVEITPRHESSIDPDKDEILIVTGEYPPYVSETLTYGGLHQRIVEVVLKRMGIPYRIEYYPWARCMKMVESGEAFATFPWSNSPDKEDSYDFSSPLFHSEKESFVMYYYEPNHDFSFLNGQSIDAFKNYNIAGLVGYFYLDVFASNTIPLDMSSDETEVFEKLVKNRIDFLPTDRFVAQYILAKNYSSQIDSFKYIEVPFLDRKWDYSMLVSKSNNNGKQFLDAFDKALKSIKEDGLYDSIVAEDIYFNGTTFIK